MEALYQFLWQHTMLGRRITDSDSRSIEIIDPGILNTDSGPDFFNAKIKIDNTVWIGNIEIHIKASDWYRHNHHTDSSYDNIILHVVGIDDARIRRQDGSLIPQVVIPLPPDFCHTYNHLSMHPAHLRCASYLSSLPKLTVTDWLESLAIERLRMKSERVINTLQSTGNDWEQTCFITLARALGFGLNSDPFEMLARSLPLRILHHHSDNPLQLQALLFGQAAMLDQSLHIFDEFYQLLCREYYFLARKYGLRPMRPGLWKYARTRPQNFPHRRIALLAKACEGGFSMLSLIIDRIRKKEDVSKLFDWRLEGYWHTHSSFDADARSGSDGLSGASVTLLMINTVIPLIYAYAATRGEIELGEYALALLETLPAENNSIIREWNGYGLRSENAMRSQALLQLRREYCEPRKCLRCRFGHHLLRRSLATTPGSVP
ncbi:MAG: DUF2851 family protein [Muribaculaceae bacterium]|nr:DUF2851 family protein [Muribaculaceae bacterium]